MKLDDERALIARQIEVFFQMIGEIDVLLNKPPNGYDKDLADSLKSSLGERKFKINKLITESNFFLRQIDGIELAGEFRNGERSGKAG
jgi:hypothetical protein